MLAPNYFVLFLSLFFYNIPRTQQFMSLPVLYPSISLHPSLIDPRVCPQPSPTNLLSLHNTTVLVGSARGVYTDPGFACCKLDPVDPKGQSVSSTSSTPSSLFLSVPTPLLLQEKHLFAYYFYLVSQPSPSLFFPSLSLYLISGRKGRGGWG